MNHPKKNRLNLDVDNLAHRQIKRRKKRDLNEPVHYDINEKKVSVFTPEFLEENRIIDGELRKLRKLNNDYEEHNSVLETYIENLTKNCDQMAQNLADANDFKTLFTAELNTLKTEVKEKYGITSYD